MPPKTKFTREQVIETSYEIVRKKGIKALTFNELRKVFQTSASPFFSLFSSIEEIRAEVYRFAEAKLNKRLEDALNYQPAFKQLGNTVITYAYEEPNLFELLFMQKSEHPLTIEEIFIDQREDIIDNVRLIQKDYGLSEHDAFFLFKQIWVYCFGICVLCAKGVCKFSPEEINQLIGKQFKATINYLKSGNADEVMVTPVRKEQ